MIELLVVIGIIAVLAGILWVVLAPARNKARIVHCINNFRQIHMALEIYRQEWGGVDPETANSFRDLCLPPKVLYLEGFFPFYREKYLVGTKEIWKCPVFRQSPMAIRHVGPDYVYIPRLYYRYLETGDEEFRGDAEAIERAFRKRREELPIVTDDYHDPDLYENSGLKMLILRLSGQVEVKIVQPKPPGVRGFEVN